MKDKLMLVPKEEDIDSFVDDESVFYDESTEKPCLPSMALSKQNEKPSLLARLEHALIRSEYMVHEFVDSIRDYLPGWRVKRVLVHYNWSDSNNGAGYKWYVQKRSGLFFWTTYDTAYTYSEAVESLNAHYAVNLTPAVKYYK